MGVSVEVFVLIINFLTFSEDKQVNFPKREVLGDEFTDEDYRLLCSKLTLQSEQVKSDLNVLKLYFIFLVSKASIEGRY